MNKPTKEMWPCIWQALKNEHTEAIHGFGMISAAMGHIPKNHTHVTHGLKITQKPVLMQL